LAARYVVAVPQPLTRVTLTGRFVQLEPLGHEHVDALVAAASVDRSTFDLTWVPDGPEAMTGYVDQLLADHAACNVLPFAQRRLDTGDVVGCTRYLDIRWWRGRPEPEEVEIGGTWLGAAAQRTPINTEAKRLLLAYAFETLGVWRVAICTDARNERSRRAIERTGATFEGILRHHRMRYNTDPPAPRDSAMYSITDDEWPAVRDGLDAKLAS
jgi:N-acetyltransferase